MSEKFKFYILDLCKLHDMVDMFIATTNEDNPYIFMNKQTIRSIYAQEELQNCIIYKSELNKIMPQFMGYKVFENNELEFGEVEIR